MNNEESLPVEELSVRPVARVLVRSGDAPHRVPRVLPLHHRQQVGGATKHRRVIVRVQYVNRHRRLRPVSVVVGGDADQVLLRALVV